MKCPQCGGEDWSTVDICPGCLRKTTGPVTMRIHECQKTLQMVSSEDTRKEIDRLSEELKRVTEERNEFETTLLKLKRVLEQS